MNQESYGERIKRFRLRRRMSQEELARRAQVSKKTITDIEKGKREPQLNTLRAIAEALGIDPMEILGP